MYNQIPVFKGGYTNNPDIDHPVVDTSHFLSIAKGNHMYVNEIGDDSKNGTLDMKHNKIVNIADPTHSRDVVNKQYVDSQNAETKTVLVSDFVSRRNMFTERQVFKKELDMSDNKISNLSSPTLPKDASNKEYVDRLLVPNTSLMARVSDLEKIANQPTFGAVNRDRLPYKQYGFILGIGSSPSNQKTTQHDIRLPPHKGLSYKKVNLQITAVQETYFHHDDLFCSIKNYEAGDFGQWSSIVIRVDTHSAKGSHWGLHLKAHLLITVFENDMEEIGSTRPSQ